MASKRLDKLRQWAGEVISSKDKTIVTEEFKDLEDDIELRRKGIFKLHQVTDNYQRFLSKKKDLEALPEEPDKLSARDALGIVMISHGDELGSTSAFGTCLVKLGQGMCKTATLQETHALTLQGTLLSSLQEYLDEIKEYQEQRKKLESRRLTYDAALSKVERLKGSKKEKDREEADDELEVAKTRFEDVTEDVRVRMQSIQENEIGQVRDLGSFLDTEIRYAENYLEVMKDVKAGWSKESTMEHVQKRPAGPSQTFSTRPVDAKFNSIRSNKSSKSQKGDSTDDEDDEEVIKSSLRRKSTSSRRKSDAEKPPSRPSSRTSRKRTDSTATVGEKDKGDKSIKTSVTGWASSAVSSIRGKKDKENFVGLKDGQGGSDDDGVDDTNGTPSPPALRKKSSRNKVISSTSPSIPSRLLKKGSFHQSTSSLQEKKLVRAVYGFTGSSDELSFKVGDEIVLLNEVLEGWWMGELDGRKGLFPTTYTEPVTATSRSAPAIPQRIGQWRKSLTGTATSSEEDEQSKKTLVGGDDDSTSISLSLASDDDDHPFGDHLIAHSRSPVYGHFGADGLDSADDTNSLRSNGSSIQAPHSTPGKKAPPPPPPRRVQTTAPPPLPDRRPPHLRSQSTSAMAKVINTSIAAAQNEMSPFDSPVRSEFPTEAKRNPFRK